MKKQDKLFSLLKRHGWEQKPNPEALGYLFKQLEREKERAYYAGFEALGWCEALEINNRKILMQKEDEHYVTYLKF